jgi:hypothetical protein
MNHRSVLFGCVIALCFVAAASAAEPAPAAADNSTPITYTPPALPDPPTAGPLLLRLFLATGAVLLLGAGLTVAVRHFAPRNTAAKNDSRLRLVETLALGNGSALYLLECCGRRFVAGASPSSFRSLAPMPEPFENELDVLTSLG